MRNVAVVFLAFVISTTAHGQCQHSFDGVQLWPLPGAIVGRADFDGDLKLDTLTTTGEIHFGGGTRVATLPRTGARFITDIDRDGFPDLVGVASKELFSMLNNGDATFTIRTTAALWSESSPTAYSADFDGDGHLDVVVPGVVQPLLGSTPIYLAAGDGTFTPEYGILIATDTKILIADINGDGRHDLIYSGPSFNPKVTVYLRGQAGFAIPSSVPQINGTVASAGDYDGDGRDDLVFNTTVFNSNGVGTTSASIMFDPAGSARLGIKVPGSGLVSPDLNGDGLADLIVSSSNGLQTYLNDGSGALYPSHLLPGAFSMTGTADIDGDGLVDLVTSTGFVHGNGDGTFRVPRMTFPAANAGVAGDFDGDGRDDVALPTAMAWNNGNNTFRIAPHSDARLQRPMRAGDTDGDGKAEVVSRSGSAVYVLSLRPDGTIVERTNIGARAIDAVVGDFTGAHRPEVAVLPDALHTVEVYDSQTGVPRMVGRTEGSAQGLAVADLNGDGRDDIVVAGGPKPFFTGVSNPLLGFLSTFISTGTSLQNERQSLLFARDQRLERVVTGDFDGDRKMDAVATASATNRLLFFKGDGSGTMTYVKQYLASGSGGATTFLQAADFDGDGRTDIAVNGTTSIFYGAATGLERRAAYFGPTPFFSTFFNYLPLIVRSRRDALPWLIVPTQYADTAYVYRPFCDQARPRAVRH